MPVCDLQHKKNVECQNIKLEKRKNSKIIEISMFQNTKMAECQNFKRSHNVGISED